MLTHLRKQAAEAIIGITFSCAVTVRNIWKSIPLARKVLAVRIATILSILLLSGVISPPGAFADQPSKPLGEVAREQRQIRKKAARQKYTNEDFATTTATPSPNTEGSEPKAPTSEPSSSAANEREEKAGGRTRLEQSSKPQSDNKDEMLVIPAGTQIIVDFTQARVAVPVRVGWTTAIPAGSKVKLETNGSVVELRAVTIGSIEYKVKTGAMPVLSDAPDSELRFVLKESFNVPR